jgi:ABC-type nitrate/sulfonate/bicarbonate transport system substrate-binding protein
VSRSIVIRGIAALLGISVMFAATASSVRSAPPDEIHVGRAVVNAFAFAALEVGVDAHIWDKVGLKLDITSFKGEARSISDSAAARRWVTAPKACRRSPLRRCMARRATWGSSSR